LWIDEEILTGRILEPKDKISAPSALLNSLEKSTNKAEPKLRSVLWKMNRAFKERRG